MENSMLLDFLWLLIHNSVRSEEDLYILVPIFFCLGRPQGAGIRGLTGRDKKQSCIYQGVGANQNQAHMPSF